ncbi:MAG: DUF3152 domain-containing protein, partial [Actinomycetota bacterium]|nr:DUF3152 domain-containing protein [Actinomycetota bacterium]
MTPDPPRRDPRALRDRDHVGPDSNRYARREHDPSDDVTAARANVRHAGVTYGSRDSRPQDLPWLRAFVHRYGWRAYALPVLVIVTVAALMTTTTASKQKDTRGAVAGAHGAGSSAPPVAGARIALKNDSKGANFDNTVLKAAALPPGAAYTTAGNGTFRVLHGTSPKVGSGQLYRYSIDIENGITGVDLTQFQNLVVTTLADSRSWSGHGVALERVDSGRIDFHVSLTSSMTVRKWCGYDIPVETSCYTRADANRNLDANRVIFNVSRWMRGSTAYLGDLATYRLYMVNHEDGHALGHNHAHQCLPDGLAPAMMQQTFGLRSATTNKLCQANPWPYP